MNAKGTVRTGAVAGFLAATAVVVFFFLLDSLHGDPLRTPRFLAGVLAGYPADGQGGFAMVAVYTVLHYAAFIGVGLVSAWAFARAGIRPNMLLGLALGVLLFDVVFYAGILLRGVDVADRLGWPALLAGNLLAGVVLLSYVRRKGPEPRTSLTDALRAHRVVREGIVSGLIGALVVAAWFLLIDTIVRQPLFTPAALGSAVLDGARGAQQVQMSLATILGYTALHFAAFFAVGLVAAAVAAEAERHSVVLLGAVLLFVTLETLFLGLAAIAASWLLDALAWWNILIANLIAAFSMAWYLWRAHPRLHDRLFSDLEEDEFNERYDDERVPEASPTARHTGRNV